MRIRFLTQLRGHPSAALFFVLILLPLIGTLSADSDPTSNRVWVSDHKTVRGVDTATNQVAATVVLKHKADALAVDPSDRALWALSHGELFKFNAQGAGVLGIDLKLLGLQGNADILVLNPYDGSVWTGGRRSLLHLNADGTKRTALQTVDKLRDVSLDIDESVWALTKHALLHLSADGTVLTSVDLKALKIKPRRLAVDSLGGWVWVSTRAYLFKFKVSDLTAAPQSIRIPATNESDDDDGDEQDEDPRTVAVAAHPVFGTLFVATKDSLLLYDRAGSLVNNIDLRPFALSHPHDLAYDAVSGSVWLGGHKAFLRFTTNGDFLASVSLDDKADAVGVTPFLLRPTVSPISPPDNSLTNNPRPLVRLGLGASCNGTPCTLADAYIQSLMLDVTLNGVQIGPLFSMVSSEAQFLPLSPLPDGANSLLSKATDLFGHSSDIFLTRFVVDTIAPQFVKLEPQNGTVFTAPQATIKGRVDDPNANVALLDGAGKGLGLQGANFSFVVTLKEGANSFTLVATDAANNSTSQPLGLVLNTLPPDPVTVAPPIDRGVATILSASTAFLYSGPNPIQRGVTPGTIDPKRAAVVRGRALTRDNNPLSGVQITILNRPEFGHTLSRADGAFDLAVNGGGVLTVNYNKPGYLPAQRQVNAPWQDFIHAPDVVLIPLDSQVTTISMNAASMQVARGSVSTDADGTRRATLLFPVETTATMTLPDGTTRALSTLSVRATEYTVGPNGPKAMPAPLPPTSGYTYAIELSVDEAIAAGAKDVVFNQPVIQYVENFLNFPVGGIVPAGYYDRSKAAWIASNNGKVIKVLSASTGLADVDADGDGSPDTTSQLAALGITEAERAQLASLYAADTSVWRVPVNHFTPWDYNWPYGPPSDSKDPEQPDPNKDNKEKDPCKQQGSIIECQNQILGERVPVVGTPFSLHYQSDRVLGRKAANTISIPLSGSSIPVSLKRIELEINVAGSQFVQTYPAAPNQTHVFTWDGQDAYGRPVNGKQIAGIRVGYVYQAVYQQPAQFAQSFGVASGAPMSGNQARQEITRWQESHQYIGPWDARGQGLGAWTLTPHHAYDPVEKTLYLGNGERKSATHIGHIITTVASIRTPWDMAVDSKGNIFVTSDDDQIFKVSPEGSINLFAGIRGGDGFSGDGGPAINARFNRPIGIAIDPSDNIYVADLFNRRVRKSPLMESLRPSQETDKAVLVGTAGRQRQLQLPVRLAWLSTIKAMFSWLAKGSIWVRPAYVK